MTELYLAGDLDTVLTHMTLLGAAAILDDAGRDHVQVHWSDEVAARPVLSADDLDWDELGAVVRSHAAAHAEPPSWTAARIDLNGRPTGLLSPRLAAPRDRAGWQAFAQQRRAAIDIEAADRRWLDLCFIGALGEPAYWRRNSKGDPLPDEGASRWEMKARNNGQEFVGNRLHNLALWVGSRSLESIAKGLSGETTTDLGGKIKRDGRTATGLASPGPVDASAVWCALWAISLFPVVPVIARASATAGHLRPSRRRAGAGRGWFYVPVPARPMALTRLRSIIVSQALAEAARTGLEADGDATSGLGQDIDRAWLEARGVAQIMRFPIGEFGDAKAPERRAMVGAKVWSSDGVTRHAFD